MNQRGRKFDKEKADFSLLPPYSLEEVAKVLTFGANKYDRDNWKYVPEARDRYIAAAMRHINDYQKGKDLDDETMLPHLAHAICCLMFIIDIEATGPYKVTLTQEDAEEYEDWLDGNERD
jgi:hypothetical protein